ASSPASEREGSARPPARAGQRRVDAAISSELAALPAARLEVAAGVAAIGVDAAGVRLAVGAVVHARAVRAHHERHLAEMPGLEPGRDVVAAGALPAHEVGLGHQDRARALEAAGAAR